MNEESPVECVCVCICLCLCINQVHAPAKLNVVAMPTTCTYVHTWLHKPWGDTSVSYTTSWFGSPEVNKLVVRAGLRTLTTVKYLISPGNTQHRGCDQPALWSTLARTKRCSARGRRQNIGWPQISLQCLFMPPPPRFLGHCAATPVLQLL